MLKFLHAWRRIKVSPVLHSARTLRVRQHLTVRMQNRAFCLEIMQEVWKAIPGYEGHYDVSDQGRVRSLKSNCFLKPNLMNHGYTCVHLYNGGKRSRRVFTVHKLVATAFAANPMYRGEVNHKNFNKTDNRVENLEWVTRSENVAHALAAGRRVRPEKRTRGINLRTKEIVTFESQIAAEIAIRGKQTGGISGAMKRGRPAYGYVWWFV